MSEKTKKANKEVEEVVNTEAVADEPVEEVVNVDEALEDAKTSGTNLQAYMRSLINGRGDLGE